MSAVVVTLHALAAVVWVGGMFFAYVILRPSVGGIEAPPERLRLWNRVLGRFFVWVWGAVIVLPMTGYRLVFAEYGGIAGMTPPLHVMHGLAVVMILLFWFLFFGPFEEFKKAVQAEDWPVAAACLDRIRRIVAINLVIGLIVVSVGSSASWWP